ncbi:MAG: hypothetical protein J6B43_13775 [Lachnospiraceae bacterium]|nr:hypothetical protein [Lachnospiraceae bacterium]
MNKIAAKIAIAIIAKKEGVKKIEVRREMERAIAEGYKNPETHHKWIEIFGDNKIPTPEEFIVAIGEIVKNQNNKL